MDFSKYSGMELIRIYGELLSKMREDELIRSKNVTGDLGEYIVIDYYRMLCSKSAGMCEFEGCNKRLFFDGITLSKFNNAYVAHIIASSAEGPRGDKTLSPLLSDKLENGCITTSSGLLQVNG